MGKGIDPQFNIDGNHHSVPKFYLRQWSNRHNLVKVTNVSDNGVSFKSPKSLTSEKNFYTATFSDGRRDSSAEHIMSYIENDASSVIKGLLGRPLEWPLNDHDRSKLATFTAYQATRVSKYKSSLSAVVQDRIESLSLPISSEMVNETNLHIQGIAATSDPYTLDLLNQSMGIFISPTNCLLTSDNPVIRNIAYPDLTSPLTEVFPIRSTLIALHPSILLVFFGDEVVDCAKPFELTAEISTLVNQWQFFNAEVSVFELSES